ncbi:hypothetical protein SASPL_112086 [Salvia splendens]|uniref:Uncharacterized protein n=1 Tax=Salvia splendens TaxID=180675 RepID=A0A8X8YAL9_SALSN|nr:hypothetical protein SASPL_112086 [Salvia splendens]
MGPHHPPPLPLPPPQLLCSGGARRPVVGPRPRRHAPALRGAQLPHLPALPRPPLPRCDPGGAVEPQRRGDADALEVGELAEEVLGIYGMGKDNAVGRSDWEDEDRSHVHDVFLSYLIAVELRVWDWEADD